MALENVQIRCYFQKIYGKMEVNNKRVVNENAQVRKASEHGIPGSFAPPYGRICLKYRNESSL